MRSVLINKDFVSMYSSYVDMGENLFKLCTAAGATAKMQRSKLFSAAGTSLTSLTLLSKKFCTIRDIQI